MSKIDLYKGDCNIKRVVHPDWLKLKNEMTIRMSNNSIDMSFLLKFYAYIDSGYPIWEHERKREIVLKEQEKTKQWQDYCRKLQEKIKQLEDTVVEKGLFDE